NPDRTKNREELIAAIDERLRDQPADAWLQAFEKVGVPAGAVRNLAEVYECEQTKSQGLIIPVEDESLGTVSLPGPPVRLEDAEGNSLLRESHDVPPALGAHTDSVREWVHEGFADSLTPAVTSAR